MAFSSQFPGAPWLNGAVPKKASGLLGLLGASSNPFTDFLSGNSNALIGLGAGIAGGGPDLGQAVGQGLTLAGQGKTADFNRSEKAKADAQLAAQTNQTQAWLQKNRPDLAGLPVDQAWQAAMKDYGSGGADPADVATYKFYAKQETDAGRTPKAFDEWYKGTKQAQKAGLGQPVFGKSKKPAGGYLPFMPMSDGTYVSPADPNANPADYTFDPGMVASDRAAGSGYGALQGPAQFNLPKAQQDVETELGNIDALLGNSTGLDQSFGNLGGVNIGGIGLPNQWTPTLPNTPKAGFQAQLAQVAGENFLSAYSTLRGAGAITEVEGQQAKEAMARLSTAQSKEDFTRALNDLKRVLAVGYQRMATQTTMGPYQSSGYTPPVLGTGPAATSPVGPGPSTSTGDPELDRALQQYGGQ
jgi:hypothetical protein